MWDSAGSMGPQGYWPWYRALHVPSQGYGTGGTLQGHKDHGDADSGTGSFMLLKGHGTPWHKHVLSPHQGWMPLACRFQPHPMPQPSVPAGTRIALPLQ